MSLIRRDFKPRHQLDLVADYAYIIYDEDAGGSARKTLKQHLVSFCVPRVFWSELEALKAEASVYVDAGSLGPVPPPHTLRSIFVIAATREAAQQIPLADLAPLDFKVLLDAEMEAVLSDCSRFLEEMKENAAQRIGSMNELLIHRFRHYCYNAVLRDASLGVQYYYTVASPAHPIAPQNSQEAILPFLPSQQMVEALFSGRKIFSINFSGGPATLISGTAHAKGEPELPSLGTQGASGPSANEGDTRTKVPLGQEDPATPNALRLFYSIILQALQARTSSISKLALEACKQPFHGWYHTQVQSGISQNLSMVIPGAWPMVALYVQDFAHIYNTKTIDQTLDYQSGGVCNQVALLQYPMDAKATFYEPIQLGLDLCDDPNNPWFYVNEVRPAYNTSIDTVPLGRLLIRGDYTSQASSVLQDRSLIQAANDMVTHYRQCETFLAKATHALSQLLLSAGKHSKRALKVIMDEVEGLRSGKIKITAQRVSKLISSWDALAAIRADPLEGLFTYSDIVGVVDTNRAISDEFDFCVTYLLRLSPAEQNDVLDHLSDISSAVGNRFSASPYAAMLRKRYGANQTLLQHRKHFFKLQRLLDVECMSYVEEFVISAHYHLNYASWRIEGLVEATRAGLHALLSASLEAVADKQSPEAYKRRCVLLLIGRFAHKIVQSLRPPAGAASSPAWIMDFDEACLLTDNPFGKIQPSIALYTQKMSDTTRDDDVIKIQPTTPSINYELYIPQSGRNRTSFEMLQSLGNFMALVAKFNPFPARQFTHSLLFSAKISLRELFFPYMLRKEIEKEYAKNPAILSDNTLRGMITKHRIAVEIANQFSQLARDKYQKIRVEEDRSPGECAVCNCRYDSYFSHIMSYDHRKQYRLYMGQVSPNQFDRGNSNVNPMIEELRYWTLKFERINAVAVQMNSLICTLASELGCTYQTAAQAVNEVIKSLGGDVVIDTDDLPRAASPSCKSNVFLRWREDMHQRRQITLEQFLTNAGARKTGYKRIKGCAGSILSTGIMIDAARVEWVKRCVLERELASMRVLKEDVEAEKERLPGQVSPERFADWAGSQVSLLTDQLKLMDCNTCDYYRYPREPHVTDFSAPRVIVDPRTHKQYLFEDEEFSSLIKVAMGSILADRYGIAEAADDSGSEEARPRRKKVTPPAPLREDRSANVHSYASTHYLSDEEFDVVQQETARKLVDECPSVYGLPYIDNIYRLKLARCDRYYTRLQNAQRPEEHPEPGSARGRPSEQPSLIGAEGLVNSKHASRLLRLRPVDVDLRLLRQDVVDVEIGHLPKHGQLLKVAKTLLETQKQRSLSQADLLTMAKQYLFDHKLDDVFGDATLQYLRDCVQTDQVGVAAPARREVPRAASGEHSESSSHYSGEDETSADCDTFFIRQDLSTRLQVPRLYEYDSAAGDAYVTGFNDMRDDLVLRPRAPENRRDVFALDLGRKLLEEDRAVSSPSVGTCVDRSVRLNSPEELMGGVNAILGLLPPAAAEAGALDFLTHLPRALSSALFLHASQLSKIPQEFFTFSRHTDAGLTPSLAHAEGTEQGERLDVLDDVGLGLSMALGLPAAGNLSASDGTGPSLSTLTRNRPGTTPASVSGDDVVLLASGCPAAADGFEYCSGLRRVGSVEDFHAPPPRRPRRNSVCGLDPCLDADMVSLALLDEDAGEAYLDDSAHCDSLDVIGSGPFAVHATLPISTAGPVTQPAERHAEARHTAGASPTSLAEGMATVGDRLNLALYEAMPWPDYEERTLDKSAGSTVRPTGMVFLLRPRRVQALADAYAEGSYDLLRVPAALVMNAQMARKAATPLDSVGGAGPQQDGVIPPDALRLYAAPLMSNSSRVPEDAPNFSQRFQQHMIPVSASLLGGVYSALVLPSVCVGRFFEMLSELWKASADAFLGSCSTVSTVAGETSYYGIKVQDPASTVLIGLAARANLLARQANLVGPASGTLTPALSGNADKSFVGVRPDCRSLWRATPARPIVSIGEDYQRHYVGQLAEDDELAEDDDFGPAYTDEQAARLAGALDGTQVGKTDAFMTQPYMN